MAVINPFERPSISPLLGVNPLEGAMMGANQPYAEQSGLQTLQQQDISNMSDLEKLRMMKESTNPTLEAENTQKRLMAEQSNNPDVMAQLLAEKMAGSKANETGSNAKVQLAQGEFMQELGNEIKNRAKDGKEPFDPMKKEDHDWWDEQSQKARKLGLPNFPTKPTPEFLAQMAFKVNDVKFNQKMEGLKLQAKTQTEGHEISGRAQVKAAEIGADKARDVATIGGEYKVAAAKERGERLTTYKAAILADLNAKPPRDPNPIILNLAADEAFIQATDKTALGIKDMLAAVDREHPEAGANLKKQWKADWIKENFNIKASPENMSGGTAPKEPAASKPAEGKKAHAGKITSTAAYNALPSGTPYTDSNGTEAVKK